MKMLVGVLSVMGGAVMGKIARYVALCLLVLLVTITAAPELAKMAHWAYVAMFDKTYHEIKEAATE